MKLLVIIILVIVAVFAVDGVRVANARRDIGAVAGDAAGAAAGQIRTTHDETKGRVAADAAAKAHHAVITSFHYDAVAAKVNVTVSGTADTFVLHYVDRGVADLNGSASARP